MIHWTKLIKQILRWNGLFQKLRFLFNKLNVGWKLWLEFFKIRWNCEEVLLFTTDKVVWKGSLFINVFINYDPFKRSRWNRKSLFLNFQRNLILQLEWCYSQSVKGKRTVIRPVSLHHQILYLFPCVWANIYLKQLFHIHTKQGLSRLGILSFSCKTRKI